MCTGAPPTGAVRVATTNMPAYEVEQTVAPDPAQVPQLAGLEVDMPTLATAPRAAVVAALRPLTDGYLDWLDQQDERLASTPRWLHTASPPAVT